MHLFQTLARSFRYAARGFRVAASERNFRIQLVLGVVALVLVCLLDTTIGERLLVLVAAALVLGSEAMNSGIERLLDFVAPEHDDEVRDIKDLMAAAVLIFSLTAFVIGAGVLLRVVAW